jgi:TonB-dependent siderophore receptor
MLQSMTFRSTLTAVACALSFSVHAMADSPKRVEIPAGDLRPALLRLSKTFGVELFYQPSQLDHFHTAGVKGNYTPEVAVQLLLKGTPLELRTDPSGAMMVIDPKAPRAAAVSALSGQASPSPGSGDNSQTRSGLQLAQAAPGQGASNPSVTDEQTATKNRKSDALQEVIVTGRYEFLSADTSGTTNLPLPIEKVPQSISIVTEDFIKAADLKTLGDIAQFTPGATFLGNAVGFGTAVYLRGFSAGRAVDGVPQQTFTTYEPDYVIFDRLEIVKGPSSVVYGVSSPGGLVNFVTKGATPQTVDYLYAQVGSWDSYRLEGQIAGALDSAGHVRAIGIAADDRGDSFLDGMSHRTSTLYGGINFELPDGVTGYLHGGYQYNVRTSFDGIPTEPNGSPAPLPRSFLIGNPSMDLATSVYHTEGDLTWHVSEMLDFTLKGNLERDSTTGITPYSQGLEPNGDLGLTIQNLYETKIENNAIALSSIYRFDDLGLKKSFVSLSALYQTSDQNQIWNYSNTINGNIFSGQASIEQGFASLLAGPFYPYLIDTKTQMLIFSAQTVLQLTDPLTVLFGVSYTKPDETQTFNGAAQDFSIGGQTSYRAGLTYEVVRGLNGYVSYSQSFNPQTAFGDNHVLLPPLIGEQYEAGVKYLSANQRLLLTAAAFQINQKNQAQYENTVGGIDYYDAIGEVTNKGVELSLLGQLTRSWQINAAYSYLNPRITRDSDTAILGQTQLFLPKQTASMYTTYTIGEGALRGLSFGGGPRYVGSERTSYDYSTIDIPGYVVADATIGYAVDKWSVQLNGHNLFDKRYFTNTYQTLFYGNVPGAPFNLALSVRRDF